MQPTGRRRLPLLAGGAAGHMLLLVVSAASASAEVQTARTNLRQRQYHSAGSRLVGAATPEASALQEQEAVTREEMEQTGGDATAASLGAASSGVSPHFTQPPMYQPQDVNALRAQLQQMQQIQQMQQMQQVQLTQQMPYTQLQHQPPLPMPASPVYNTAGASAAPVRAGLGDLTLSPRAAQLLQQQQQQMELMQEQLKKQQEELLRLQQVRAPTVVASPPSPQGASAAAPLPQPKRGALVAVKAHADASLAASGTEAEGLEAGSSVAVETRPKGWDQCLKFARYIKGQEVTGVELVRTWKATCEPAVQSGKATARYKLMCNSLTGVVEPFSAQIDYDVEQLCSAVLAVFHDVTAADVQNT